MTVFYAVTDDLTGAIIVEGVCADGDLALQAEAGQTARLRAPAVTAPTHMWDSDTEEFVERPVMAASLDRGQIIADAVDEATISSVPDGAAITIRTSLGRTALTMDTSETLVLTSADPDALRVKIQNWPDQDVEFEIAAFIGTRVDVPAGALEVSALPPTVTADAAVAPSAGGIVVTGHAPSLAPEPAAASVELTGLAPDVQAGVTAASAPDNVVVTGLVPQVAADSTSQPAPGSIEIAGQAPTVSADATVTPGAGSIVVTGLAPTVSTT